MSEQLTQQTSRSLVKPFWGYCWENTRKQLRQHMIFKSRLSTIHLFTFLCFWEASEMMHLLQSTHTCNNLKIPIVKLHFHSTSPALDCCERIENQCKNKIKEFCRDWGLTLNTSEIKKLSGFRLKTTPGIVLRLWAALTMQAHHQALQSGRDGREWLKACVGRNKLHSSGFASPHITKKGKEIFSGDINLHLNTVNYLLYFGSLAKHLTFKPTGDNMLPGNLKRQFCPDNRAQAFTFKLPNFMKSV